MAVIFWLVAALLILVVVAALLRTLLGDQTIDNGTRSVELYRRQLDEFQEDADPSQERSLETELARAEIARRLLKAIDENDAGTQARSLSQFWRERTAITLLIFVPLTSVSGYLLLGSPRFPTTPRVVAILHSAELQPTAKSLTQIEAKLRTNPNDGQSWDSIAPTYFRIGRLSDAKTAYSNAIRILGPTAHRASGLGEVLVMMNSGRVTETAKTAFETALNLRAEDPKASFYLAIELSQTGHPGEAIKAFRTMEKRGPTDAPWLRAVRERIGELERNERKTSEISQAIGPENRSGTAQRDEVHAPTINVVEMVSQLDERLRKSPQNIEGWKQLVRSYVVLKEQTKAQDALTRGLKTFTPASEAGKELLAVGAGLGLVPNKNM
jgi:cytochrome c-type biogenesis protein CcmH